jgi:hypothetical protein
MSAYRIWSTDINGCLKSRSTYRCVNDDAALQYAMSIVHPLTRLELWEGSRFVGTVAAVVSNQRTTVQTVKYAP